MLTSPEPEIVDLTMDEDYEDANEPSNSQITVTAADDKPQEQEEEEEAAPAPVDEPPAYSDDDDDDDEIPIIPCLEEQRSIINDLIETTNPSIHVGMPLYIIPAHWFNDFRHKEFKDAADAQVKLRSINTHGIMKEGGLFCDRNILPLTALHEQVFEKLREWYGMAHGCSPVVTYAVFDEDGTTPVPEYTKPCFHLHHLVPDSGNTSSASHFGSSYTSIPVFAISRLHNFSALVQVAVQTLTHKEHLDKQPAYENKKFRIWIIQDGNESSLDYMLTTSTFMNLSGKYLVKKEHLSQTIESTKLSFAHLCIEEKTILAPPPPPPRNTTIHQVSEHTKIRSYWPSLYLYHFPPTPSDGRIGLQNLGNTCYMNSALQCLVHIPELTQYFLFGCYHTELNADNPLGYEGKVALSFANLIHHLFDKKASRGNYYVPRDFKGTIGYFNDMFSGYQQQDSQEFLAFLLDCLHEDLNRIIKKPMTTKQELSDHEDAQNMNKVAELAEKSWELHKLRNDSIITDLFVGMYKSTLVCPVCDKISITFDPFNDLTLPLFVDQVWERSITLFLEDGHIKKFDVELQKTATYETLRNYVAEKLGLNPNFLFTAEIWNQQFYKNFESSESQSGYLPLSELMSPGDDIVMYEVRHSEGDLIIPVLNTVNPPNNIPDSFGVPFFISVTQEERKSFGAIRQKLEHRYEQLSTFKYFSKVRSTQEGHKFTIKDFPLLSKPIDEDVDGDSGYDSDVSLAHPEISGDYAFTIKVFDSSREVKNNRSRRLRLHRGHARSNSEEETERLWMPNTQNNFTQLPNLLDMLDEKKRSLYTYAKKLDLDTSTSESGEISTPSSAMDKELMEIIDNGIEDLKTSQDDDDDVVVDLEAEQESKGLIISDGDDSPEMDIEPLTTSLTLPSMPAEEIQCELTPSQSLESPVLDQDLVGPRVALVCEWDSESFDTFFVGLEGEGEDGKETWTKPEVIVNEEVEESKRIRASKKNEVLTLDKCLELFSKPEVLSDHDLWKCSTCDELRAATKQIQIWNTPDILTIHLKRFQNQRSFSDKIDAVVDFPIEGLDMTSHLACPEMHKEGAIYDLFAVDNHYGGIGGGHYTAYAKNFVDNKWYYYNDSHVSEADPVKSISGAAYLLFYKRRSSGFLGGEHFAQMLQDAREEHDEREKKIVEMNETFYRENLDTDEEESDSDLEDVSESDSEEDEYEPVNEVKVKHFTSPMVSNDLDDDSSDNVSVPVGSEDDQRRKQRLISRGKGPSIDRTALFSDPDVDSMGAASPVSVNSDDDSSTYSSSVHAPAHLR